MFFYTAPDSKKQSNEKKEHTGYGGTCFLKRERKKPELDNQYLSKKSNKLFFIPLKSSASPGLLYISTVRHPYCFLRELYILADSAKDPTKIPKVYPQDLKAFLKFNFKLLSLQRKKKYIIYSIANSFSISVEKMFTLANRNIAIVNTYEIAETWNRRFPECKSYCGFTFPEKNMLIKTVDDIRNLHYFCFFLNIQIFILFFIQKTVYNLKLGPDEALSSVHLFRKYGLKEKFKKLTKSDGSVVNKKWMEVFCNYHIFIPLIEDEEIKNNNDLDFMSENNNILVFSRKCKSPVLFFKLIKMEIQYLQKNSLKTNNNYKMEALNNLANVDEQKVENKALYNINFFLCSVELHKSFHSIDPKFKIKIEKSKQETKIKIEVNLSVQTPKLESLFDTIQFNCKERSISLMNSKSDEHIDLHLENNFLIAESINNSAFLVQTKEIANKIEFDLPQYEIILKDTGNRSNELIIYGNLKDHPLIFILCYKKLLRIMINGSLEIIEKYKEKNKQDGSRNFLFLPDDLENDANFGYNWKAVDIYHPTPQDLDKKYWLLFFTKYPLLMVAANTYGEYCDNFAEYAIRSIISDTRTFVKSIVSQFEKAKEIIKQIKKSEIGLNTNAVPAIIKLYHDASVISCIQHCCNEQYNDPLNTDLLNNVHSIQDFDGRVTENYFKNKIALEANIKNGVYPVRQEKFCQMIKNLEDIQISDLLNRFKGSFGLSRITEKNLNQDKYQYTFYRIIDDHEVVPIILFKVDSIYEIKYAYVGQYKIISVAVGEEIEKDSKTVMCYVGTCEPIDTEMKYQKRIKGTFISAVYMESIDFVVISFRFNNEYYLIGYDFKFNNSTKKISIKEKFSVKSLAVISQHYFAVYGIYCWAPEESKYFVFKIYKKNDNSKKYCLELKPHELWRIKKDPFCELLLKERVEHYSYIGYQSLKLDSDLNGEHFFNTQFKTCLYSIQKDNFRTAYYTDKSSSTKKENGLPFHFRLHLNSASNKRSQGITSYVPERKIRKNQKNAYFNIFDLNCSLCEFFPSLIVDDDKIVYYDNEYECFSYFSFDYKMYRSVPFQIYGHFIRSLSKLSFFAIESLIKQVKITTQIIVVVDLCGFGANFANLVFGTKFEGICDNEVWAGFSYSKECGSIILLFKVNDTLGVFHALKFIEENNKNMHVPLIVCGNSAAQIATIVSDQKFGNDDDDFNINFNSLEMITFCSFESDFYLKAKEFRKIYINDKGQLVCTDKIDTNACYLFGEDERDKALQTAKEIISFYLTAKKMKFHPIESIRKYCSIGWLNELSDFTEIK